MRRRRRNPDRTYFVKDAYTGHMEDFGSLKAAFRYAMKSGSFVHADDVVKHIYVEQDESYVPLSVASRSAAKVVVEYANRNPMRFRRHSASLYSGRSLDDLEPVQDAWRSGNERRWRKAVAQYERKHGQVPHTYRQLPPPQRRNPPKKLDRARHVRIAMNSVTSGWDYDLVSAEDSIAEHEEEYGIQFTPEEKAYIVQHAKKGSHMESTNPRRRKGGPPRISRGHVSYSGYGVHSDKRRRALDRIGRQETREERSRNPLPYEHSARILSPSQVDRSSYRRKNVKGGSIGLLFAKLKSHKRGKRGGVMKLASVHFRAAHFTPSQARSWMRNHKLRPILFEAATEGRKASWQQESVRARRSGAHGRRGRQRRRVA